MEIQKNILIYLSSLRTPFLNTLAEIITFLGEEQFIIAVGLFIFWNISKKNGFTTFLVLMVANLCMQIIKAIIRFPRPWVVYPNEIDSLRKSTATGYSFPSGHTTISSSFYGTIALVHKKKVLSVICISVILLVGFSRLYLGVHWPLDVIGGLLLGSLSAILLSKIFEKVFSNEKIINKVFPVLGFLISLSAFIISLLLHLGKVDHDAFSDLSKCLSMFGTLVYGYFIEEKICKFEVNGSIIQKICRYIIGAFGAYFFLVITKSFIPYNPLTSYIRYSMTGAWSVFIWPFLGKKLKLFA